MEYLGGSGKIFYPGFAFGVFDASKPLYRPQKGYSENCNLSFLQFGSVGFLLLAKGLSDPVIPKQNQIESKFKRGTPLVIGPKVL